MATFLLLLLAVLTSQLVSWFLYRAARSETACPQATTGQFVMHYSPSLRMAATVLPAIALLLLVVLVFFSAGIIAAGTRTLLLFLMPLLLIGAAAIVAEAFGRYIVLDDKGIRAYSVFGERSIRWEEVSRVDYNPWRKLIVVYAVSGQRVSINPSLSGIALFELMLFERVERDRFNAAIPGFLAIQRGSY
jgi:hypothetical protein